MTALSRVALGVYRDRSSLRAIVNTSAGRREKRFPHATPLPTIERWRQRTARSFARQAKLLEPPSPIPGTFRHDVESYVASLQIPSRLVQRSYIRAWLPHFSDWPRDRIAPAHVEKVVIAWKADGYRPSTIRHRREALRALYKWVNAQ